MRPIFTRPIQTSFVVGQEIWVLLNEVIVVHGLAVLGGATDAPIEARRDTSVVETHFESFRVSIIVAGELMRPN